MSLEPTEALDLATFLDSAVSPAHAVNEVIRRLEQANFQPLDERTPWSFQPGQRSFVTRGTGSIVAIEAGQSPPSEAGFVVIGAHTDSPNLRLRPNFDVHSQGHALLSVEPYGSPLLHTWLDRDLGVAGTLVVAGTGPVLYRCLDPVARISSLAIHLNRDVNQQGLKLDAQLHLRPTVALDSSGNERAPLWDAILKDLSKRLGRSVELGDILAFDLGLFDEQATRFVGANRELLTSGRLDNLASCHGAITALLSAAAVGAATRVVVLYDHEEVGSRSSAGAQSPLLSDVLSRVAAAAAPQDREAYARAQARSLLLSADMAHAVHPNYGDKHDEEHRPRLGQGPVLKLNVNQSYATDIGAMAAVENAARAANCVLQKFVSRNDIPCGSTIGPITAARTGIRTADIGAPLLSMHSCREVMAESDIAPTIQLMQAWLEMTP
jgi:aspartyl aminopeptidase